MRSALAFVLLAAAACGGTSSATSSTTPENTSSAPSAPPWSAMFVQGHTWTFEAQSTQAYYDSDNPNADEEGTVRDSAPKRAASCTVAQVLETAGGKASKIECDWAPSDHEADSMGGNDPFTSWTWYADASGLYVLQEPPAAGAQVTPDPLYLVRAATPAAFTHEISAGDMEEGEGAEMMMVEQKGDAWCWTYGAMLGDESWQVLCFGPSGIVSGEFGWAGGSEHTTKFTVVK